ncbi:sugar diacid recognition domain-containing protein, partial [Klebsiella pneumoniae]|uniref:sugar diacid recognition domain-containing protein n=2 Tax=Klebsiella pneumoniae TaxID=573 RepID=UPI002A0A6337
MIITTALANEIVARAMAIIHHNVNVIDHHGQIIASGERHRIGEQHEVAREVIRTGKRICINNAAEAVRFHNVHPGINHPIIYDDRVVMVVGISGDPAAISRYAELAVLTAELLVRQAIEMRETNWRQRLRDTLFCQYLEQGATPAGQEALHRGVWGAMEPKTNVRVYHRRSVPSSHAFASTLQLHKSASRFISD